ncbi:MAG TPA: 23S rRNA pseudouridine(1911/1915/1917) synthase RluD [Steroidobacteraceae bacterium]|nr:23S rRNA pseudouridine(1911/1915/1917) synthase RluD [Steroidobacteraceae bacterium]
MTEENDTTVVEVPAALAGARLDAGLAKLLPQHSRTRIRGWIDLGLARMDGRVCRPRDRLFGGERITVAIPRVALVETEAQAIKLAIVHMDDALYVVNKPAGLVVHPGAGNPDRTLLNALLALDPGLREVPRAGIVHRLDKDTSGLLVVARTPEAQTALVRLLAARAIQREYLAICVGLVRSGGSVDAPIARHRGDRTRMAVRTEGREARTHYRVVERFRGHSLLRVALETGRTHQIRVHLAHIKAPIVGDPVYGGRLRVPRGATPPLVKSLAAFKRQALHAERLALEHPVTGESLEWTVPMPADLAALVKALRIDAATAQ